ncbi:hypothetical protein Q9966_016307 [Columba livia]|nr:hypothetical protein Q9966_016307 [Columba livia]
MPRNRMTWRDFPYKTFRPALQDCNGLENSAGHVQLRVLLCANYLDYRLAVNLTVNDDGVVVNLLRADAATDAVCGKPGVVSATVTSQGIRCLQVRFAVPSNSRALVIQDGKTIGIQDGKTILNFPTIGNFSFNPFQLFPGM